MQAPLIDLDAPIHCEPGLLQPSHQLLKFASRPLRKSNDTTTPTTTCQFSMALRLHTLAHNLIDLEGRHPQLLQIRLIHTDSVPDGIHIDLRFF